MKANAKDIVVQSYNLVCSDEMLSQWHMENRGVAMSDEKIRSKLLKDRITELVGDTETKDSFFIYGRGMVGHAAYIVSSTLTHFMRSVMDPREHSSTARLKKSSSKQYLRQVEVVWTAWLMRSRMAIPISSIRSL